MNRSSKVINEKTYELTKNLLLVIKSEDSLSAELWEATWKVCDLPELKEEVFPTEHITD